MKNKDFTLGLNIAGKVEFVLSIRAKNIRAAKKEWARLTGHLDNMWDVKSQTYMDWPVVVTDTEPLQRKGMVYNPFSY